MKKRILVLEDDAAIADLLKFYFEDDGYEVQACSIVKEFKDRIEKFSPDLITLDIVFPDAHGLDILKDLQNSDKTNKIPVLLISGKESEKEKGLKLGAMGFFGKPLNITALKNTIKDILKDR